MSADHNAAILKCVPLCEVEEGSLYGQTLDSLILTERICFICIVQATPYTQKKKLLNELKKN